MSDLPHLLLKGTETAEQYIYAGPTPIGVTFERPVRNQPAHAKKVRGELREAGSAVKQRRAKDAEAFPELVERRPEGVVLTFLSDPNHELKLQRLERDGAKIQLLGVTVRDDGVQIARVFVPEGKLTKFLKLVEAYAASTVLTYIAEPKDEAKLKALHDPDSGIKFRGPVRKTKEKKIKLAFVVAEAAVPAFKKKIGAMATLFSESRKHAELIDSIASVRLAIIQDYWQDRLAFPGLHERIWWEFWLHGRRAEAEDVHGRFAEIAGIVGISPVSPRFVAFPERVVVHARATAKQISSSVDLMAMIGELRKAKDLATHYLDLSASEQADFINDVVDKLVLPPEEAPRVCILDAGVNRPHPLLEPALAAADQHTAEDEWGVSDHDVEQHGTGMAGIALYGCLTGVMQVTDAVRLRHRLESVKILPPTGRTEPPDYGRRMQDGVALAHIKAARRNRVLCMAVTASDHRDGGLPSLWSGAVDDMCAGVLDGTPKLMLVSAGNMRYEIGRDDYVYHEWNITRGGIEDPGQSWNALTIGAYTEKAAPQSPSLRGYTPVADPGGLCPTSRTSLAWPAETQEGWPIKPDLVLEGGNYVRKDGPPMTCEDLSLLTTIMRPGRLLTITHDTSPATAEAARMAAILWSHHPKFRPETIRALLVHSAKWTQAMMNRFPGNTKTAALQCLRC
jgi:hypothetical protein